MAAARPRPSSTMTDPDRARRIEALTEEMSRDPRKVATLVVLEREDHERHDEELGRLRDENLRLFDLLRAAGGAGFTPPRAPRRPSFLD